MLITIHGRASSINVQAVMWCAAEIGLEGERLDVGGQFKGNDTPEFLSMNPMGRVPVLQDGEFSLFESQTIMRYLATRYEAGSLWPAQPEERAVVDQWMEWGKTTVSINFIAKIFWQLVRVSRETRDMALVESGIEEMNTLLDIAEAQITRNGWLAAEQMTLADISFGTMLYRYYTLDFVRGTHTAVSEYYKRLTERPAYRDQVMISFASLYAPGA